MLWDGAGRVNRQMVPLKSRGAEERRSKGAGKQRITIELFMK